MTFLFVPRPSAWHGLCFKPQGQNDALFVNVQEEAIMVFIVLWLLGVPLGLIVLLWLLGVFA